MGKYLLSLWRLLLLALRPLPILGDWAWIVGIVVILGGSAPLGAVVLSAGADYTPQRAWSISILVAVVAVLLLVAGYKLQRRVDEAADAPTPNVVLDGFKHVPVQFQERIRAEISNGRPVQIREPHHVVEFWLVRLVNQPVKKSPEANALDVCARIHFFDEEGTTRLLEVPDGRWGELPELKDMKQDIKCIALSASGESATLNILTHDYEEAEFSGWDNHGLVRTKEQDGLPVGTYQVCVVISVSNEGVKDKLFWFTVINRGDRTWMIERSGYNNDCSTSWLAVRPDPDALVLVPEQTPSAVVEE